MKLRGTLILQIIFAVPNDEVSISTNTYISEYLYKCEQVWWTDVEDEASTSETGKQGTCTLRTVCGKYGTYIVQYM
jgi:hypothetical protein